MLQVSPYMLTLFIDFDFDFGRHWKWVIGLNRAASVVVLSRAQVSSSVFWFSSWKYPLLPVFGFFLALRGNYVLTASRGQYHNYYLGARASLMAVPKRPQNPESVFLNFHWEQRGI